MGRGLLLGGEDTGRLYDILSTILGPRDLSGIPLSVDGDGLSVNDELSVFGGDVALEASVYGIILEHVDHVVKINERAEIFGSDVKIVREYAYSYALVYSDDIHIASQKSISENDTSDTTCAEPSFSILAALLVSGNESLPNL